MPKNSRIIKPNEFGFYHERKVQVSAYGDMIVRYVKNGYTSYLLTVTYRPIYGSKLDRIKTMKNEVEAIYSTILNRSSRNPRYAAANGNSPILIGAVDLPVKKKSKQSISHFTTNYGYHTHNIILMPPTSRIKKPLDEHMLEASHLYQGRPFVDQVDVRPIDKRIHGVVDYAFKSIINGRISYNDGVIILTGHS